MKLLGLDTSTAIASAALQVGDELFCEEQSNQKTHAQFILPMIERLMKRANLQMNQLDAIVFGRGPGSFTGLRITCSIAKGLAYAHDLNLIPVSSLAAIAWSVRQQKTENHLPVLAVIDARMQEMYWSYFNENQWITEEYVDPVHQLWVPEKQPIILAGVGVDLYWNDFTTKIKTQISDNLILYPSASAMIQLAQFCALKPIPVADAQPVYVRNKVT